MSSPSRRLNVGCGAFPLPGWTNLDADPSTPADIHAKVPPIPFRDESLDHILASHFLEHLTHDEGAVFLGDCYRCLVPGGRLTVIVPDTLEVMKRYVHGSVDQIQYPPGVFRKMNDLDEICRFFIYSTVQDSPHRWCYDLTTLRRAIETAGFQCQTEVDRFTDPLLLAGAWYQCGWHAIKPKPGKWWNFSPRRAIFDWLKAAT